MSNEVIRGRAVERGLVGTEHGGARPHALNADRALSGTRSARRDARCDARGCARPIREVKTILATSAQSRRRGQASRWASRRRQPIAGSAASVAALVAGPDPHATRCRAARARASRPELSLGLERHVEHSMLRARGSSEGHAPRPGRPVGRVGPVVDTCFAATRIDAAQLGRQVTDIAREWRRSRGERRERARRGCAAA